MIAFLSILASPSGIEPLPIILDSKESKQQEPPRRQDDQQAEASKMKQKR
ncbi:MAG: hypothetical protein ACJ8AI_22470 [Rhodopila sp.]